MDRDELERLLLSLRQTRREARQFVLTVVGLALILEVVGNVLFNQVWQALIPPVQAALFVLILLIGCFLTLKGIDLLYAGEKMRPKDITLLVPLHVTHNAAKIEKIGGYPVTELAQLVLGMAFSHDPQSQERFVKEWRACRGRGVVPLQGFVRQCVHDLVQFLLLQHLSYYGEASLGHSAPYRGLAVEIPSEEHKVEALPPDLATNYFLEHAGSVSKRAILLPQESDILAIPSPDAVPGAEPQSDIALHLKHGEVVLRVSPFWSRAGEQSKTGRIIERHVTGRIRRSDVWGVIVRIRLVPTFRGFSLLFSRDFEQFYLWSANLFSFFEQRLDWGYYLQGDLERMIVDIRDRLDTIHKALPIFRSFSEYYEGESGGTGPPGVEL